MDRDRKGSGAKGVLAGCEPVSTGRIGRNSDRGRLIVLRKLSSARRCRLRCREKAMKLKVVNRDRRAQDITINRAMLHGIKFRSKARNSECGTEV